MSLVVRPAATQELVDLLRDIRAVDPAAADRVEKNVARTLAGLEAFPLSGTKMRTRSPNVRGLRIAPVRRYPHFVILYLPLPDGIDVLHIIRGRRHLGRVVAND